jgi:hypothetical protein
MEDLKPISQNLDKAEENVASDSGIIALKGKQKEIINITESLEIILQKRPSYEVQISNKNLTNILTKQKEIIEIENQLKYQAALKEVEWKFQQIKNREAELAEKRDDYALEKVAISTFQAGLVGGTFSAIAGAIFPPTLILTVPTLIGLTSKAAQEDYKTIKNQRIEGEVCRLKYRALPDYSVISGTSEENQEKALQRLVREVNSDNEQLLTEIIRLVKMYQEHTEEEKAAYENELQNLTNERENQLRERDEERAKLEREIERLNTLGKSAIEEANQRIKDAEELVRQKEDEKRKNNEALREQQSLLQSKERAEYEQINEKYKELEKNAKTQEEKLELLDQRTKEYIALIYQKDEEHNITIMNYKGLFIEYEKLEAKWKLLSNKEETLSLQNKGLYNEVESTKGKLELKELELTNRIEEKDRNINLLLEKQLELRDREDEKVKELIASDKKIIDLTNTIARRDEAITEHEAHKARLQTNLTECATELSQQRAHYQQKIDELGVPQWYQKTTTWLDIENANKIWARGVFLGRSLLIVLIGAVICYIASWIIRILVAVVRNIKAAFTKKQDDKTILAELFRDIKQVQKTQTEPKEGKSEIIKEQPILDYQPPKPQPLPDPKPESPTKLEPTKEPEKPNANSCKFNKVKKSKKTSKK